MSPQRPASQTCTNLALPNTGYAENGNLLGIFELAKPQLAKLGIRMIYVGVAQFNDRPMKATSGERSLSFTLESRRKTD